MNLGMKPLSFTCSNASWKSSDGVPGQFPAGLRVLVVDDDPTCLRILEKMLRNCLYEVTKCNRAEIALKLLRDNKNGYDIVISDVHMPDMDGFKLLEHVGLEMDLPVIMMSADDGKNVVMKGVTHGACDYLIKPVRMEALKNIWQHVVRKKKHEWKEKDSGSLEDGERQPKVPEEVDYSSSANDGNWKSCSKKRKEEEDDSEERDDSSTLKKPRVVWSVELHQQFVTAVNQLGIEKAVPKKILELMNVPGLSRENVASHLQKYRLYLRRLSGVSPHPNSFMGPPDASFGPMSSLIGLDLQALAASGQLPPHSLATNQVGSALGRANQRNVFSFENPELRFIEGQQQQTNNNHQVNLLHGIPTNMDAKQLANLHQSTQSQMVQRQPWAHTLNEINGSHDANIPSRVIPSDVLRRNGIEVVPGPSYSSVSQPSARVDFSRTQSGKSGELEANSFSLVSNNSGMSTLAPKLHEEANLEMKVSRGFVPSYDVLNGLTQNRTNDWDLQNVGSTFNGLERSNLQGVLEVPWSVLVEPGFSTNQKNGQSRIPFVNNSQNVDQRLNSNSSVTDNSLRVKSERLPDAGFHGLYPGHFGQDDIMSALLKQQQEGTGPVESEFGFDGYHVDNLPVL